MANQIISFHLLLLTILSLLSKNHALSSSKSIRSICKSTPYPNVCVDSLNVSVSENVDSDILVESLKVAISEASNVLNLLLTVTSDNIYETQKGSVQDCIELYEITVSSLNESLASLLTSSSANPSNPLGDVWVFLSAASTNTNTCLEGLESAYGPIKPPLVDTISSASQHVSNSLSLLSRENVVTSTRTRTRTRTSEKNLPKWLTMIEARDDHDRLTVAADGTGNFTTITDAINFAPNNSVHKVIIYIKRGLYKENVNIPRYKTNIVLRGEGRDVTIISGDRSAVDGWTTFRCATVAVSGNGFSARDIGFHNTAGPEKHQAVALRINAHLAALYKCTITSYQDSLYVHSFTQFFRECDIFGTIDFIFGNAAVMFQKCNIFSRKPMPKQFTVITAQSRNSSTEQTGILFKNCYVLATEDLRGSTEVVKSYLGRPWMPYSRTVFIESYIDSFIDPKGWIHWSEKDEGLDTVYYGEYENIGPGSSTLGRVTWLGHRNMDEHEAESFTVSKFINGEKWLPYTTFPYDN